MESRESPCLCLEKLAAVRERHFYSLSPLRGRCSLLPSAGGTPRPQLECRVGSAEWVAAGNAPALSQVAAKAIPFHLTLPSSDAERGPKGARL